eukprot:jgi/Bigna1/91802/estExt_fgenesh1_pg.C_1200035
MKFDRVVDFICYVKMIQRFIFLFLTVVCAGQPFSIFFGNSNPAFPYYTEKCTQVDDAYICLTQTSSSYQVHKILKLNLTTMVTTEQDLTNNIAVEDASNRVYGQCVYHDDGFLYCPRDTSLGSGFDLLRVELHNISSYTRLTGDGLTILNIQQGQSPVTSTPYTACVSSPGRGVYCLPDKGGFVIKANATHFWPITGDTSGDTNWVSTNYVTGQCFLAGTNVVCSPRKNYYTVKIDTVTDQVTWGNQSFLTLLGFSHGNYITQYCVPVNKTSGEIAYCISGQQTAVLAVWSLYGDGSVSVIYDTGSVLGNNYAIRTCCKGSTNATTIYCLPSGITDGFFLKIETLTDQVSNFTSSISSPQSRNCAGYNGYIYAVHSSGRNDQPFILDTSNDSTTYPGYSGTISSSTVRWRATPALYNGFIYFPPGKGEMGGFSMFEVVSTSSPATASPATASPTTVSPTASPATASPTASPATASPATVSPTASPATASPATVSPTASPATVSPTASPATVNPTANPTASPTTGSPTSSPATVSPTANPTTANPTTVNPTTVSPTSSPTDNNLPHDIEVDVEVLFPSVVISALTSNQRSQFSTSVRQAVAVFTRMSIRRVTVLSMRTGSTIVVLKTMFPDAEEAVRYENAVEDRPRDVWNSTHGFDNTNYGYPGSGRVLRASDDDDEASDTSTIVGAVLGVFFALVIAAVVWYMCCKKKNAETEGTPVVDASLANAISMKPVTRI